MAEKKTSRISVDLCESVGGRRIIHSSVLTAVGACGEFFKGLGEGGGRDIIEVFRITFTSFNKFSQPGPRITICLRDPIGRTCSYTTDFRFIGDGDPEPTEEEIIDHLNEEFIKEFKKFLEQSRKELDEARRKIDAIL